jgi:mucin-2
LGENHDNGSSSCFTKYTPTFYQENYYQKTLFGSTNNDFTVDNDKGYPIDLNPEGIPLKCKFLTSEQKAYLEGKFQEIEKINNKLLKVKDPKEKEELSKNLQALNKELHKWREEATTVKVEDGAIENTES